MPQLLRYQRRPGVIGILEITTVKKTVTTTHYHVSMYEVKSSRQHFVVCEYLVRARRSVSQAFQRQIAFR